jgi:hypothetical protein
MSAGSVTGAISMNTFFRPGIPLLAASDVVLDEDRILLSAGIAPADGQVVNRWPYRSPAFVPRQPWRLPTPQEFRTIVPDRPSIDGAAFIALVRISEPSLQAMHALGFGADLGEAGYLALSHSEPAGAALQACLVDLWEYLGDINGLQALGFAIGEPGIPTVATTGAKDGPIVRAGLHVDDWDRADVRAHSRNRLHLNLGLEPRHLLYVHVPVDRLDDCLPVAAPPMGGRRGTQIGNAFMRHNPDHPIVRVRIDPGEAYIAPTDHVIHDGDSTGKRLPDVNYALLGRFVPPR